MQVTRNRFVFLLLCGVFFLFVISTSCDRTPNQQGKRMYTMYCASCHMEDGEGLRKIVPALTDRDYLHQNRESIPCIIRHGIKGPMVINGKKYDRQMAGFPKLNNIAIYNITNYIFQAWNNDIIPMNIDEVDRQLESCPK